ncbi:MAG: hypothetical protein R3F47_16300 [Gammaproteobacteria bacterium]
MFEGVPTYPDASRRWQVIDKHAVNIFIPPPRRFARRADEPGRRPGEKDQPRQPAPVGHRGRIERRKPGEWYYNVVGDARCPVVDTWWQTETGAIMIAPLPGAAHPETWFCHAAVLWWYRTALVDAEGKELHGACEGNLVIKHSWPVARSAACTCGDHQRCVDTYFSTYPGNLLYR